MPDAHSVLSVENDRSLSELLASVLGQRGHRVESCADPDAALAALRQDDFDAVVWDLDVGNGDLQRQAEALLAVAPGVPIVLVTSFAQIDRALETIRAGAHDYFTKPFRRDEVWIVVERALRFRELQQEISQLKTQSRGQQLPVEVDDGGRLIETRSGRPINLRELESVYIDKVLERVDGNKVRAARMLGINRRTLYRRGKGGTSRSNVSTNL